MGVKAKIPHFALERVKSMVEAGQFMIQQGRARVFLGGSFQEARAAIKGVIADLSVRNFSHSVQLTWDMADIYGVRFHGGGWYLKLTVDCEMPEVAIISFHPLEAPLRTNGGEIKP
jgi:hypothetical protein